MKKLLLVGVLCFSISANANEGKYDDCIVVGDMGFTKVWCKLQDWFNFKFWRD